MLPEDWDPKNIGGFVTLKRGHDLTWRDRRDGDIPIMGSAGPNGFHDTALAKGPGVVLGRSGASFGQAHYCELDFWPHNTALYVTDFKDNDPLFVYYLFSSIDFSSHNSGCAQQSLNRNFIAPIGIGVPSPEEQGRLAKALSDVDELIKTLEELISKKRNLKQAAMQELLTGKRRLPGFVGEWEVKRLGDFADCTSGGTPATGITAYWGGNIRWMSSGELHLKRVAEVAGRITTAGLENSSAKLLPPKCVLVGLAGQGKTRGTTAISLVELSTNQSIAAILPNSSFVPEYLYYCLDSRYDELRELSSGSGGRGGLNLLLIKTLRLPMPKTDEQAEISATLSDIDCELRYLESKLSRFREIKQGMMQQLLTGKIRLT